ncbi:MAG: sulfatase-like hydrolase/transferase [Thermodesulfobacteriota bacterium]
MVSQETFCHFQYKYQSLFSLLSGHYDFFYQENFGTRPNAPLPSLYILLGKRYETFIVTPSPIAWYFPEAFVKNSGIKEIHHYGNLPFKTKEERNTVGRYIGRDEIQTFDFFIKRIMRAKEPFLGIYISFAAYLPYFDYGQDFRVRPFDGRMIHRYYNNLYLLDCLLKKMFDCLKEIGLLERTVLVIVGDHGQAFRQHHPDNYMHHRYSYNENLETPAIFYQPAIFKPRTIDFPTSHIDIILTLLDALGFSYEPSLFDGESLFQIRLKRNFLYFYGHEGTLSSLSSYLTKIQYSYKKNRCWAFDLKTDPEEQTPLSCHLFKTQWEDLQQFVQYHNEKLLKYNEFVKEREREE